jgi:hypothetical protein
MDRGPGEGPIRDLGMFGVHHDFAPGASETWFIIDRGSGGGPTNFDLGMLGVHRD